MSDPPPPPARRKKAKAARKRRQPQESLPPRGVPDDTVLPRLGPLDEGLETRELRVPEVPLDLAIEPTELPGLEAEDLTMAPHLKGSAETLPPGLPGAARGSDTLPPRSVSPEALTRPPERAAPESPSASIVRQYLRSTLGQAVSLRIRPGVAPRARPGEGDATLRQLGRYPVAGLLGRGGMGEVYQVEDVDIGRRVAAKVARGQHLDLLGLTKFVIEAQITGQLEHPNIVPVYELGVTDDDRIYFTMKQVGGVTLADLIEQLYDHEEGREVDPTISGDEGETGLIGYTEARKPGPSASAQRSSRSRAPARSTGARKAAGVPRIKSGGQLPDHPLTLVELLEIFLKVCDAIRFAHRHKVIHRDLKPENIMVGEFGEVLVMDWGLAKPLDPASVRLPAMPSGPRGAGPDAGAMETVDGTVMGTPAYMPPEQAAGHVGKLDIRSDVYSLGAILYEMLTLRTPFGGKPVIRLLEDVAQGRLIPPAQRNPDRPMPWELEAVVMKAMALRRKDRYQTVGALRADISRFLEGRVLSAARYSLAQRAVKALRRNRVASLLTAMGLLVATVATAWGVTTWRRGRSFDQLSRQATAHVEAGEWAEAVTQSQRALDLRPGDDALTQLNAQAVREEAKQQAAQKAKLTEAARYRALQKQLSPVIAKIEETRPFFHVARVDIRAKLDELERGLGVLVQLAQDVELARYPELWSRLGTGWYFVGDLNKARQALERAVELDPGQARAAFYLGRLNLARALAARRERDFGATHATYTRLVEQARALLAASHGRLGGSDAVDQHLADTYLALATGRTAEVVARCADGLTRYGNQLAAAEYHLLKAWALEAKDPEGALAAVSEAIEWRPHDAWAYVLRGMLRFKLGPAQQGVEDLGRAIEINPRLAVAYMWRGGYHSSGKQWSRAIADYDQAIKIQPGYLIALFNRANARRIQGDLPGAIADYDRVLKLDDKHWQTHLNRGVTHLHKSDLEAALRDFGQATRLAPAVWQPWLEYGKALRKRGRRNEAIAALQKALKVLPPGHDEDRNKIERLIRQWSPR